MSITLTTNQENFIQTKLKDGKYQSAEEVLEIALRLLDEYERSDAEWVDDVRHKIDDAILVSRGSANEASKHTTPIDGEAFVDRILQRFQQA